MLMNNEWTYADFNDKEWVYPTFKDKVKAIEKGKLIFSDRLFVLGQLSYDGKGNYNIINEQIIYPSVNYI